MKPSRLGVLLLASLAIACSGSSPKPRSAPEAVQAACADARLPLPEGTTAPVILSHVKPKPGRQAPYDYASSCLEIQVETDGSVTVVRTIFTNQPAFTALFRDAVVRWRYKPAQFEGKPVPVRLAVGASFERL